MSAPIRRPHDVTAAEGWDGGWEAGGACGGRGSQAWGSVNQGQVGTPSL